MALDDSWYTETYPEGAAFSLKVSAKLHEEQTEYQKLEIFQTEGFGRLMTLDGLVMLTDRDNFIYHEMMTHPALFTHPAPKRVAVIGGGDCGTLREVLRHPEVELCEQIELDERVTRVSEEFFPELCEANDDVRASFTFTDGIQFIADCDPGSFDVIIVDSTDPVGPAAGLFSVEFYANCHRALADDGLLAAQSESPLFHVELIQSMHENLRAAGFARTDTLQFPQCSYPSGWWSATLGSKGPDLATPRTDAIRSGKVKTSYYTEAMHHGARALPGYLARILDGNP